MSKLHYSRSQITIWSKLPWWLITLAGIGVIFCWQFFTNDTYQRILLMLSGGIWVTIYVTFLAFFIATLVGLFIALAGFSKHRPIREFARFYVEFLRGVPVLVLLFYIAFVGAPQLVEFYNFLLQKPIEWQWIETARTRDFSMTWRAIMALSVAYSAFIAEVFRAGIQSVDQGQIEAAKALGLKSWERFRLIILPQALRNIFPPLANDFISMVKDSALVSALGVQDITQLGKLHSASSFQFFETYNVVAFLYLSLTITLSLLVRFIEYSLNQNRRY
ncbi:amino acid ABC transporter permease [Marinomonas agarivorans]|nr:amino acid ABC transporter permease [Marinomonas agarivorans]